MICSFYLDLFGHYLNDVFPRLPEELTVSKQCSTFYFKHSSMDCSQSATEPEQPADAREHTVVMVAMKPRLGSFMWAMQGQGKTLMLPRGRRPARRRHRQIFSEQLLSEWMEWSKPFLPWSRVKYTREFNGVLTLKVRSGIASECRWMIVICWAEICILRLERGRSRVCL